MKLPLLSCFAITTLLSLSFFVGTVKASTSEIPEEVEPQVEGGLSLPCWQPDEYRGNFDIRIWPEDVVIWLEQENLKSMVRDPEIPEEERAALKRILAIQMAFHPGSRK